jgi:hypothetical protein
MIKTIRTIWTPTIATSPETIEANGRRAAAPLGAAVLFSQRPVCQMTTTLVPTLTRP